MPRKFRSIAMKSLLIEYVEDEIWIVSYPVHYSGIHFDARMTIIRVDDGSLMLHSPCEISPELAEEINCLGPVSVIVAPSNFHYLHVESARSVFPSAKIWLHRGIFEKTTELAYDHILCNAPHESWENTLDQIEITGNRIMNEVAFYHIASQTLILVDAIENIGDKTPHTGPGLKFWWKWVFHMWNKPKPAPEYQLGWKDKAAARRCLEQILEWDFNKIILAHGDLIENNAREIAKQAWDSPLNH